ncbi:MerR family DNA-binding protein [Sphingomonadaceae bacterium jetA1]|uniref:MerR family transcriptional regulator n=1 Tax=Facivitalis istanbulensis TaxID=3075838 RepID=UPI00349249A3
MANWTIAGLAQKVGVGVETVRYYQRRGLLPTPERSQLRGSGQRIRRYGETDLRRLRFIRSAQSAGFTLEQIGELLALDATNDRMQVRALTRERIAALDARIVELQKARAVLTRLAEECGNGQAGPCPILISLETGQQPGLST